MVWNHLTQFVALARAFGAASGRQDKPSSSSSNASHTASDDFVEVAATTQHAVVAPCATPADGVAPRPATAAAAASTVRFQAKAPGPLPPRRGRNRSATAPSSVPSSASHNNSHPGHKTSRRGKRGSGATCAAMRRQESAPSMRSPCPTLPTSTSPISPVSVSPILASPVQASPISSSLVSASSVSTSKISASTLSSSPIAASPTSISPYPQRHLLSSPSSSSSPSRSWPRTPQRQRPSPLSRSPNSAHNEAWWSDRLAAASSPSPSSSTATAGTVPLQITRSASNVAVAQRFRARSIDEVIFSMQSSTSIAPSTPPRQVSQPALCTTVSQALPIAASSPSPPPSVATAGRRSSSLPSSSSTIRPRVDPSKYKTERCRNWDEHGRCPVRDCQYAHGEAELRPRQRHPLYKTKKCRSYHGNGHCDYGSRCDYIHDEPLPASTSTSADTSDDEKSALASSSTQVTVQRQGARGSVMQEPLLARIGLDHSAARVNAIGAAPPLLTSQHSIWRPLPPLIDRATAASPPRTTSTEAGTARQITCGEEVCERLRTLGISPYTIAAHQALGGVGGSQESNSTVATVLPPQPRRRQKAPPSTPNMSDSLTTPGSWHCNTV